MPSNKQLSDLHLYFYISHFLGGKDSKDKNSLQKKRQLAELVLSVARIRSLETRLRIFTNLPQQNRAKEEFLGILEPLSIRNSDYVKIHSYSRSELVDDFGNYNPWLLTWKHKDFLRKDYVESHDDSIFVYLEDDAIFTEQNLEYWINSREELREAGFIPGFLRAEWSDIHQRWVHSDSFTRRDFEKCIVYRVNHDRVYLDLDNPYSASIVLDKSLAQEYLSSRSSFLKTGVNKHSVIWDTGAAAALGLIDENVPENSKSRVVFAFSHSQRAPDLSQIVRHQGDRYANEVFWKHFALLDWLEERPLVAPRHTAKDYFGLFIRIGFRGFVNLVRKRLRG